MTNRFFETQLEQSKIKSEIVAKYFDAWSRIIGKKTQGKIAYIDLFSGPGRYKDGTQSTPLLVLKKVIENSEIRSRFVSIFTDKEKDNIEILTQEVATLQGIETLKHQPKIWQEEIGENIAKTLEGMKLIPSLMFLDPCGYKGLSLKLINATIKNWACECVFLFNFNRIKAGIHNDRVEKHINDIFGKSRAEELRKRLMGKSAYQRELLILRCLVEALKDVYGKYVQHFCVKHSKHNRTSHYLVFVTKNFLGYEIMRDIMAKCSSYSVQGVPSFEYNKHYEKDLFHYPLNDLKEMLLKEFAGQSVKMNDIYKTHSPGMDYIRKNYKEALKELFKEKRINAKSPGGKKPQKGTMGNNIMITFP
jgi:three-Cys-motif partner protein